MWICISNKSNSHAELLITTNCISLYLQEHWIRTKKSGSAPGKLIPRIMPYCICNGTYLEFSALVPLVAGNNLKQQTEREGKTKWWSAHDEFIEFCDKEWEEWGGRESLKYWKTPVLWLPLCALFGQLGMSSSHGSCAIEASPRAAFKQEAAFWLVMPGLFAKQDLMHIHRLSLLQGMITRLSHNSSHPQLKRFADQDLQGIFSSAPNLWDCIASNLLLLK